MLVKRNPVLPNIFNDMLNEFSIHTKEEQKLSVPSVNVKESEKDFILKLAAPGLNKKDFKIDIIDGIMTISAEIIAENDDYILREYNYQSFKRTFDLPNDIVDLNNIKASYKNGELIIEIPKKEIVVEKSKLIEVK
jgi:HSP20 family protein